MLATRFTELVGCTAPIQQAGMGPFANPHLAAAVAEAGGLGTVSAYGVWGGPPEHVEKMLRSTRERTDGVFGANFIMRFVKSHLAHDTIKVAAEYADVVEFFYTDPDRALIEIVHAEDALVCWQIGSREEAVAAVDAGCDFIVAQGVEAGGPVRGRLGVLALLDQILGEVEVPVLASGGLGSGRAMAAVLAAGADGVRVGTRFLAVEEAGVHPEYLQALIDSEAQDTVFTEAFSVTWPDAPHRVLRSSVEEARAFEGDIVGMVGGTWNDERHEVHPFEPWSAHKSATGKIEAMPLFAGEGVGNVTETETAAAIIHDLTSAAEELLRIWC